MFDRRYLQGSLLLGLMLSLVGCSSPTLVSITITPASQYFTFSRGLTVQFTAIGTFDQGTHPKTTQDITKEVTWKSNTPGIATINATGLVTTTGVDYGTTNITASMNGFTGLIIANATANVCGPDQVVTGAGCANPPSSTVRGSR